MTSDTIGMLAAAVFLLIAVVGGGFTVKELSVPAVPTWGRIVAGLLGVLFVVPFVLGLFGIDDDADKASDGPEAAGEVESGDPSGEGSVRLCCDGPFQPSEESIRLLEVVATSDRPEPVVGDRITVSFTIQNVGQEPFLLTETFVAARDPDDANGDFGHGNGSYVLEPAESVTTTGSRLVNQPGTWQFTPCYAFEQDGKQHYCPMSWNTFPVLVSQ
jgi:hypothetical protein